MSSSAEFEFGTLQPQGAVGTTERSLEQIIDEARDRGHAEGFAAGRADALAQLAPAADAMAEALVEAQRQTDVFVEDAERAAVELALALAGKIVGAAVEVQPELVLEVVAGALRRTTVRDQLVLELNPEDFDLVRDAAEAVAGRIGGVRRMDIVAERRVGRGGCVIRTGEGEIDARVDQQLVRAAEIAADVLRTTPDDA